MDRATHLTRLGARLWNTGLHDDNEALEFCLDNKLSDSETMIVLRARSAAEKAMPLDAKTARFHRLVREAQERRRVQASA